MLVTSPGSRPALTPAGQALVEPVRQLLASAATLPDVARAAGQGEVGRLRLGFVSTVAFGPLPGWLRGFREVAPGVEVVLREATTDVQMSAFEQGEADAGFVLHAPGMSPGAEGLQSLSLGVEPMLLALPESSPLASAPRLKLSAVLEPPLVIYPRAIAPSLYDAVLAFYHRHGASPAIAQEAIQMQTIVNLVSAGLGLAWVPESMKQLQRPGVVGVLTGAEWMAEGRGEMPTIAPVDFSDGRPMNEASRPVFAHAFAKHVGDTVAMVVAEGVPRVRRQVNDMMSRRGATGVRRRPRLRSLMN